METASFRVAWAPEGCRVEVAGQVDAPWLDGLLEAVRSDRVVVLDFRRARLSPDALGTLTNLVRRWPRLQVEPDALARLLDPGRTERRGASPAWGDILATLAHEVRGPLTLAHMRLQTLAARLAAEHREEAALACRRSMGDLMATVRLFNFYLAAAQPWRLRPVHLDAVAAEAVSSLEEAPEGQEVAFRLEATRPAVVRGDERALGQLVYNLLLNAAQAAGPGGRVEVGLAAAGRRVVLTVADDGGGFPPEVLQEPFVPYRTGRRGGTGLGLVICKWIVDRHGGEIALANRGPGALVTVALPADRDA